MLPPALPAPRREGSFACVCPLSQRGWKYGFTRGVPSADLRWQIWITPVVHSEKQQSNARVCPVFVSCLYEIIWKEHAGHPVASVLKPILGESPGLWLRAGGDLGCAWARHMLFIFKECPVQSLCPCAIDSYSVCISSGLKSPVTEPFWLKWAQEPSDRGIFCRGG